MRSLKLVAPLLLMSGCNLFRSGHIEQTCEDLPRGCGGTIDTQPTDDTGDSAPWVPDDPSTVGMALVSIVGDQVQLRVFDPAGALIQESVLGASEAPSPGPVAYDPIQPRIMLWDNSSQVLFVAADGSDPTSVTVDTTEEAELGWVYDTVVVGSVLYLVTATSVWTYLPEDTAIHKLGSATSLAQIQSVFPAFDDNLFLLNWSADATPDLFRFTISTSESRLSYESFDDSLGRSSSGFQGPAAKPHVCSGVGGVYSVEDLQGDDRAPIAFPSSADLQDLVGITVLGGVTDCGWDDGAERFLLASPYGVFVMDEWGRVDATLLPEGDEQLVRAAFYMVEDPDAR